MGSSPTPGTMLPCVHCCHPAQVGIIRTFDEPPEIVCDGCLLDLYPKFLKKVFEDRQKFSGKIID